MLWVKRSVPPLLVPSPAGTAPSMWHVSFSDFSFSTVGGSSPSAHFTCAGEREREREREGKRFHSSNPLSALRLQHTRARQEQAPAELNPLPALRLQHKGAFCTSTSSSIPKSSWERYTLSQYRTPRREPVGKYCVEQDAQDDSLEGSRALSVLHIAS
eukprot:200695-Rhodomonas_salina.1